MAASKCSNMHTHVHNAVTLVCSPQFKTTFEREPYLNLPPHLRVPIAKLSLRLSCHPLQIETGVLGWDVPPLNCPPRHVVLGPAVPQDNLS